MEPGFEPTQDGFGAIMSHHFLIKNGYIKSKEPIHKHCTQVAKFISHGDTG